MAKRVVICGGTGLIGSALHQQLEKAGYDVVIVSRHPKGDDVGWDQLASALDGAKAVINLAGRSIACKFSEENKRQILESRLESTKNIADAVNQCRTKPEKWINSSATGFYGDRGDEILTESSPPGKSFQSEVCIQWEAACLKSPAQIAKTVIRTGVVMSARGGVLKTLIPLTKMFAGGAAGSGKHWLPWIHIDDIVGIYCWAIDHDTPEILSGSAPEAVMNRDFMAWLRKIYNRPWSPPIPSFIIELEGKLIGPDSSLVLGSCRIAPTELRGYTFKFPTLESISQNDL